LASSSGLSPAPGFFVSLSVFKIILHCYGHLIIYFLLKNSASSPPFTLTVTFSTNHDAPSVIESSIYLTYPTSTECTFFSAFFP
jgi:hypothetical protein